MKTQKAMKTNHSECGRSTEQAIRETLNPELAQGRATAAKKGQQREERRHNRPEQTAKNRKQTPGEWNGKTTDRRDAEEAAEAKQKKETNPKGEERDMRGQDNTRLRQESRNNNRTLPEDKEKGRESKTTVGRQLTTTKRNTGEGKQAQDTGSIDESNPNTE